MIMITSAVISKGMPFAVILMMGVLAGSFGNMASAETSDFPQPFIETFMIFFGDFPQEIADVNIPGLMILIFGGSLILLNLYIAIVSDIFDEYQTNAEMIEVQTILLLTRDAGRLVQFWNRKDNFKYFHHCTSILLNQQQEISWEGKVKQLENAIKRSNREANEKLDGLSSEITCLREDMTGLNSKFDKMMILLEHRKN